MRLIRLLGTLAATLMLAACGGESDPAAATDSESTMAVMNGTVTYRERMALRLDAVVTVRLEDVSLADAPALVLAETSLETRGQSIPIPWQLEYDPRRIRDNMTYAVRAQIRDGQGALLWTSDTVHPVLTRGAPSDNVEIVVVPVSGR